MNPFPRFRPDARHRPRGAAPSSEALRIRWLGTAAHAIESASTTLLIDPFLSRPSLLKTAFSPLRSSLDSFVHHLPSKVDAILLGHSHYDHLLDAPAIALRTGAKIVGSATTAAFARAGGVPEERIVVVPPSGASIELGDFRVRFVPSRHGKIVLGRVPFPGELREEPRLPARLWHYRMGGAYGILLEAKGRRIYHNGSADLVDAELSGLSADVLLVGLAGRRGTPEYFTRLARLLGPRVIIPTHHDAFFAPLEEGVHLLPGIDLPGFGAEVARVAPEARFLTPTYDDVAALPWEGDIREGFFFER